MKDKIYPSLEEDWGIPRDKGNIYLRNILAWSIILFKGDHLMMSIPLQGSIVTT